LGELGDTRKKEVTRRQLCQGPQADVFGGANVAGLATKTPGTFGEEKTQGKDAGPPNSPFGEPERKEGVVTRRTQKKDEKTKKSDWGRDCASKPFGNQNRLRYVFTSQRGNSIQMATNKRKLVQGKEFGYARVGGTTGPRTKEKC